MGRGGEWRFNGQRHCEKEAEKKGAFGGDEERRERRDEKGEGWGRGVKEGRK